MTPIEKLRRIADMTALEGVADAIREVADEMERSMIAAPIHTGPKMWWMCEADDLSRGAVWTREPDADDVAWVSRETKRKHVALRLVPLPPAPKGAE